MIPIDHTAEQPTASKSQTLITNSHSMGERMDWEHGDHSGTITFPGEERGPVDIQWDGEPPDDWEEIEALVEAAAFAQHAPHHCSQKSDLKSPNSPFKPPPTIERTTPQ